MRIYTITLNPAYDIHAEAEHFLPYHENLARVTSRDAGGKGVNISRALKNAGVENTALVVVGQDNSADFTAALSADCLDTVIFKTEGRIRENITLHSADAPETRISFSGFALNESILQKIADTITVDGDTVITFTGRVPNGISIDAVKSFLLSLKKGGAKIVIDSRSFTLSDIFEVSPYLIKPNEEEIAEFLGEKIGTIEKAAAAALKIHKEGVENVMISLGGLGAVLACREGVFSASAPKITPISTIGAGDSSIAGFISAANEPCDTRLKRAIAFGSAACLTAGSRPPLLADIEKLLDSIEVNKI